MTHDRLVLTNANVIDCVGERRIAGGSVVRIYEACLRQGGWMRQNGPEERATSVGSRTLTKKLPWRQARVALPIALALMLATPSLPQAQQPRSADSRPFKPEELEHIVAPIVQYPDPLLAQIFMASAYPLEVIQAARFAKANPSLKGGALNEELKKHTWDDSVKALVSFPEVLAMMDGRLEWMQKLGEAFLAQQQDTMAAVQRLRAKAQQPSQSYWYYCPSAGAYYPTAPTCPEPWIKVPPRAQ